MTRKSLKGWLKHGDFILIDLVILQVCFVLAFWINHGIGNPYIVQSYQYQAAILLVSQLAVILFLNAYDGVVRRRRFDELLAVIKYIAAILIIALVYLFAVHQSLRASRLQLGFTALFFVVIDYLARQLNKKRIFRMNERARENKALVLITSASHVREAVARLTGPGSMADFFIKDILLLDAEEGSELQETQHEDFSDLGIPVSPADDAAIARISHDWVDEVFILQPENMNFPSDLLEDFMEMGISVNYSMAALNDERWPVTDMKKLGGYKVLKSSIRFASAGQLLLKRIMDILGGIAGCILTGIIFIFVAPAVYRKSPGPIFFSQQRVGRNGKLFKIYKFRSMYMDAEERKAALMAQNKIADGMMFKMDDDPRIIGSEKKGKDGKPKGIGNFIRNTSLDEFPQFLNVLKGEMSLVGTRPPTLDEWKKYDLGHRVRMSIKPGITGMWQVSGRSEITDFEEIVRLDRDYIENWSLALDIKILFKTVWVVLARKGAE